MSEEADERDEDKREWGREGGVTVREMREDLAMMFLVEGFVETR